jgi:transposase
VQLYNSPNDVLDTEALFPKPNSAWCKAVIGVALIAISSAVGHAQRGDWLDAALVKLSTKSDTAGAIRYARSRWRALTRYVDDGQLEIDNNAAERALRVVALGRKNYLFAGSDAGGERAAAIYSLLGSAKLNGLDPELYLQQVLERIADHPINRITDLLPWNVPAPPPLQPS